jgi:hypothetical protein
VIIDANAVHVVYHDQDTALSIRLLALVGGSWSSQFNIATGSGFSSFDAAVGTDGRLGVAWCRDQLYYREYDGSNWGAIATLETHPIASPQMFFEGNVPVIAYLDDIGGDMKVARVCDRRTGSFETARVLDGRTPR